MTKPQNPRAPQCHIMRERAKRMYVDEKAAAASGLWKKPPGRVGPTKSVGRRGLGRTHRLQQMPYASPGN